MAAGFLRNAVKRQYSGDHLWRIHSIADSIKAPVIRNQFPRQQQQPSKAFGGFPNPIYRKAKELDFSVSSSILSSPFSSTASSVTKIGVVGWYLGMIKSRPILTKSITSALIYTVADFSSQVVALMPFDADLKRKIARPSSEPYDLVRTLRMTGYGMLILGPSLHFWFNFVSKVLPKRDLFTTMAKIVMGQTLYGPTMTVVFFSVNAGLQGENGKEIFARLKRDFVPTMISGVMYWPLCDFITFKFIPVQLQPLVSNSFSYLWTVYITYMASLEKADVK